jgi:hypothetical protein
MSAEHRENLSNSAKGGRNRVSEKNVAKKNIS